MSLDVFPTPAWCVHRLLEAWSPQWRHHPLACLEPAAGDGSIVDAAGDLDQEAMWLANDIRDTGRPGQMVSDFLSWPEKARTGIDLCISNPPFSLAEAFVRQARTVSPGCEIVMLLRLGFLASAERAEFYDTLGAPDLYVLPNRPGFTADGKTDMADYAWFRWPAGKTRSRGEVVRLGLTSAAERGKRVRHTQVERTPDNEIPGEVRT